MATAEESLSSGMETTDTPVVKTEKPVMVVGIEESEHSYYALEWTLDHFFVPFGSDPPFKLLIVHPQPLPSPVIDLTVVAAIDAAPIVEKIVTTVIEQAKQLCNDKGVREVALEVAEGDAGHVMCEAAEKHGASVLVVGSHGYGTFKRAFMGGVSDHCAHHARCTVMIVKNPKSEH